MLFASQTAPRMRLPERLIIRQVIVLLLKVAVPHGPDALHSRGQSWSPVWRRSVVEAAKVFANPYLGGKVE